MKLEAYSSKDKVRLGLGEDMDMEEITSLVKKKKKPNKVVHEETSFRKFFVFVDGEGMVWVIMVYIGISCPCTWKAWLRVLFWS
jgi:hypothetical protein